MFVKLDLQYFSQEKTEKATPKKRRETREKGQVAKSNDVNTAFILLLVFLSFSFLGSITVEKIMDLLRFTFQEYMHLELTMNNVDRLFKEFALESAMIVAPIMGIALLASMFSNYVQVGFLVSTEAIKFNLSRIDPIKGAKRIFSLRAIVEFLKSLLKIILVGAVVFTILWGNLDEILKLSLYTVNESAAFVGKTTLTMGLAVAALLLFLSIFDYMYQRYEHEKNIRMSKQEVKDEYKKTEGDPLIKSKIKEKQRQMAMSRMMAEVPKADVVITNPTHYAVALKYDENQMDAPVVVAKGVDYIALKIINIAKNNDVVTVENRPLARALYAQADIGEMVPEDLFKAVAEVLAYVYRMKNKL